MTNPPRSAAPLLGEPLVFSTISHFSRVHSRQKGRFLKNQHLFMQRSREGSACLSAVVDEGN